LILVLIPINQVTLVTAVALVLATQGLVTLLAIPPLATHRVEVLPAALQVLTAQTPAAHMTPALPILLTQELITTVMAAGPLAIPALDTPVLTLVLA